ncbi:hypothetical protein Tco_0961273 [Tanacetum coccineum]
MAEQKIHQALTISSIKNTFTVELSLENGQYLSWSELFKIHCHAYKVIDHIIPPTRLVLEETRKNKQAANASISSGTACVATAPSTTLNHKHHNNNTSSYNSPNPPPQRNDNSNRGRGRNNGYRGGGRNGGRGHGRGRSNNFHQSQFQQWTPYGPWAWSPYHWASPPPSFPTAPWSRPTPPPSGSQGILGPRPTQTYAASTVPTELDQAFNTMSLNPPDDQWYMDTGATSHMTTSPGTFSSYFKLSIPKHILVGNGNTIPIRGYGHMSLPSPYPPLHLKNVLHAPHLIKNLISVRRLSTDNNLTIAFDPYGFFVYNFQTGIPIMRCNSIGDLYPITSSTL